MDQHTGSTGLFAVFALSIFSLFLFPYTLYAIFNSDDQVVQPSVQAKKKKDGGILKSLKKLCTRRNFFLLLAWGIWLALLWYVKVSTADMKPFDPFEILQISSDATPAEIRKAYRTMSLKYHPDKNPDPKAHKYFAESVTKAYEALTDDAARQNYIKYGHPDGPQAIDVGVALPEWLFTKDSKLAPLMLLGLVGIGILLPLGVISWYMLSSNKYSGPNNVMAETIMYYFHSKFSIKESQSLVRIPETLVCCSVEFINMPTPAEQEAALDEVRRLTLRAMPDLKDKAAFWKRKASVLKAHMLLLVYLERMGPQVPANLQADLKFVLAKCPVLLEEMLKIATCPRAPAGYGWFTPTQAVIEMMQCIAQAVPTAVRRPPGAKTGYEATAALLQLPGMDEDALKRLKRRRINAMRDLVALSESERVECLVAAGLSAEQAEAASLFAQTLPSVYARAECEVEGEEEVMEQDMAKCRVRVVLTRPLHRRPDCDLAASVKAGAAAGKSVRALTPQLPQPKDENWFFILADTAANSVLAWSSASLAEAEAQGFATPTLARDEWERAGSGAVAAGAAPDAAAAAKSKALATADKFITKYQGPKSDSSEGQVVELTFMAPRAGKHDLQLYIMCDSYVGCDRVLPLKLRVVAATRAAQEGRDARSQAKAAKPAWSSDDEDDDARDAGSAAGSDKGDSGSDSEDSIGSNEYDSEEDGEEETDSETEAEPATAGSKADKSALPAAGSKKAAAATEKAADGASGEEEDGSEGDDESEEETRAKNAVERKKTK